MKQRIIISSIIILIASSVFALDLEKMQTAVRVQERIIDTLIDSDSSFTVGTNTDGLYLAGFGSIFTITIGEQRIPPFFDESWEIEASQLKVTIEEAERALDKAEAALKSSQKSQEAYEKAVEASKKAIEAYTARAPRVITITLEERLEQRKKMAEKQAKNVERMVESLKGYLADYGPALRLPADEMALLRVEFEHVGSIDRSCPVYEISASGSDMDRLRSGNLSQKNFVKKISVKKIDKKSSTPSDITIMENILNTAFERKSGSEFYISFFSRDESWGTYIPGFGALFFRRYNPNPNVYLFEGMGFGGSVNIIMDSEEKEDEELETEGTTHSDKAAEEEDAITALEDKIGELMATYAPTLKSLMPSEQMVVAVKLRGRLDEGKRKMLVMKLKKIYIDKYKNSSDLRNKIEVIKM